MSSDFSVDTLFNIINDILLASVVIGLSLWTYTTGTADICYSRLDLLSLGKVSLKPEQVS